MKFDSSNNEQQKNFSLALIGIFSGKTFLAGPTLAGLPEDRLSTHKEGVMLEISKRRSRPKRQAFNFVPKIPAMNSGHHILDWPFEFGHLRVDNGSPGKMNLLCMKAKKCADEAVEPSGVTFTRVYLLLERNQPMSAHVYDVMCPA